MQATSIEKANVGTNDSNKDNDQALVKKVVIAVDKDVLGIWKNIVIMKRR